MYGLKGKLANREDLYSPWITFIYKWSLHCHFIRYGTNHREKESVTAVVTGVPSSRYDFHWHKQVGIALQAIVTRDAWEIKYWGLRTINIAIFYLLTLLLLINKPNKECSSLLYFFVFRNLVLFLARLRYPCYFVLWKELWIHSHTETHKYNKDEYSLFSLLIKRQNITIFIVRRPHYSISHEQRLTR